MNHRHLTRSLIILGLFLLLLAPDTLAASDAAQSPPETSDNTSDAPPPDTTRSQGRVSLGVNRNAPEGFEIPWFTMSPRIGYAYIMPASLTGSVTTSERHCLMAGYGFDLGGKGLVMEILPLYMFQDGQGALGDFHSLGMYMGLNFRWRWWNFVPSAGIGFRGAYLIGSEIEQGMELVGRFPLMLTWYPTYSWSMTFEVGLSYGATGIQAPVVGLNDMQLGHSFGVDMSVGTRFP